MRRRWLDRGRGGSGYQFVQPYPTLFLLLQFGLFTEAIVRGANFIATPPGESAALKALETSSANAWWGYGFIVLGVIGGLGETAMLVRNTNRGWQVSFVAHAALAALMLISGVTAIAGIVARTPLYGFTGAYDPLLLAIGHVMFLRARHG